MLARDIKIPLSFDYEFYKKDKPFLQSKEEANKHFETVGRRQGLKGSPACDQGYLLNYIRNLHPEGILEIGPGCAPKFKGANVRCFDVKSKEELQQRYKNDPRLNQIPDEIHYVDKTGSLKSIKDKFDVVFSSHAIEHTLDLIDHLNEVESVLHENGLYLVVVPNKNFTFDYFKPISVIEDVLAKHFDNSQTRSFSLRSMLLEVNRRTHNSPAQHWANDHGELSFSKQNILAAITRFESTANNSLAASGYHNWIFTEESFIEIVNRLHELELISLKVHESYNTPFGGMSFSAILRKSHEKR